MTTTRAKKQACRCQRPSRRDTDLLARLRAFREYLDDMRWGDTMSNEEWAVLRETLDDALTVVARLPLGQHVNLTTPKT